LHLPEAIFQLTCEDKSQVGSAQGTGAGPCPGGVAGLLLLPWSFGHATHHSAKQRLCFQESRFLLSFTPFITIRSVKTAGLVRGRSPEQPAGCGSTERCFKGGTERLEQVLSRAVFFYSNSLGDSTSHATKYTTFLVHFAFEARYRFR